MLVSEVLSVFSTQETFLLLIHRSPDGDAVSSALALWLALKEMGKTVDAVCVDPIPYQFQFLYGSASIKNDFFIGDYEVIVTLDCGDAKRTGFSPRLKELVRQKQLILVNIDHHPKNDLHTLATYNIIDFSAPSTSYLVADLIRSLHIRINHKIATCLLTGLYTDTGGFKHSNTTPKTLQFAATMLAHGARLKDITHNISQATSVARLKLWGVALSRVQQHQRYNIVSTIIRADDIAKVGASEDDVAGIAALLATIPADVAILIVERNGQTQVRMRTKHKKIDLERLAMYLGGGGRRASAGFTVTF